MIIRANLSGTPLTEVLEDRALVTYLEKDPNDSQSIRFVSSFPKTGIFGIPVHQVELKRKKGFKLN